MIVPPLTCRLKMILWLGLYLSFHVIFVHLQNGNTMSRMAFLYSLCEGELNIDAGVSHTVDWSRTPDGHYFSNKPPGPVLMAFPFYWVYDGIVTREARSRAERDEIRYAHTRRSQHWISLLFQVIPMAIVLFFVFLRLEERGVSQRGLDIAAVTALFANTASLYSNIYFGHAMSAWLVLALFLSLDSKRYGKAGFILGWLLLTEYTLVVLLPVCLWAVREDIRSRPGRTLGDLALGGIVPAIIFAAYHMACFGGPFTTAVSFQNPAFVDVSGPSVLGVFHLLPSPYAAFQILFGGREGILWTQPWIYIAAIAGWLGYRLSRFHQISVELAFGGLLLLLLMISAFGSWHGGKSAGPRYLSPVFPLCGIVLGLGYDRLRFSGRFVATTTAALSALFFLVVSFTLINPLPEGHIWEFYWRRLDAGMWTRTHFTLGIWILLIALVWWIRPAETTNDREERRIAA
jgi:hypothetical protein